MNNSSIVVLEWFYTRIYIHPFCLWYINEAICILYTIIYNYSFSLHRCCRY